MYIHKVSTAGIVLLDGSLTVFINWSTKWLTKPFQLLLFFQSANLNNWEKPGDKAAYIYKTIDTLMVELIDSTLDAKLSRLTISANKLGKIPLLILSLPISFRFSFFLSCRQT